MQKNRLNSSAENSGKKKDAEQILISTHNAAIKDNLNCCPYPFRDYK